MAKCDRCGKQESMPYNCRLCGSTHCGEHRLPENHDCPGLDSWGDPDGVFDSGFDDTVRNRGDDDSGFLLSALPGALSVDTGPGGVLAYFRGNMAFTFLALMWLTFLFQFVLFPVVLGIPRGSSLWYSVFTVNTTNPLAVWGWVVSVFAHGGPGHIFINSIVLYFFGPVVEDRIGTKAFAALFLASGVVAGLAQVGAQLALHPEVYGAPLFAPNGTAVLGASGAIAALLGVLTVLNPNLRIYLYFILPMPLWIATALFVGYSVFVSSVGGIGAGGTAQLAHLAGVAIGLLYGVKLKREGERAPQQLQFGGGPGGPGGPGGRGRF